jgi:hypothetical protein
MEMVGNKGEQHDEWEQDVEKDVHIEWQAQGMESSQCGHLVNVQ